MEVVTVKIVCILVKIGSGCFWTKLTVVGRCLMISWWWWRTCCRCWRSLV